MVANDGTKHDDLAGKKKKGGGGEKEKKKKKEPELTHVWKYWLSASANGFATR
jgi:hypothetical protein